MKKIIVSFVVLISVFLLAGEANAFALWHTFLKPEIQHAMWSQEEGERW